MDYRMANRGRGGGWKNGTYGPPPRHQFYYNNNNKPYPNGLHQQRYRHQQWDNCGGEDGRIGVGDTRNCSDKATDTQQSFIESVIDQLASESSENQTEFIQMLLPRLDTQAVNTCRSLSETLSKRDFVGSLPPEIVRLILDHLSLSDQARMARVSKKWRNAVSPLWLTACLRYGLIVKDDEQNSPYWISRCERIKWRRGLWRKHAQTCLLPSQSDMLPSDHSSMLYVMHNNKGHMAAATKPGMIVLYPESERGGSTHYIKTGVDLKPSCTHSFGPGSLALGFETGLVQHWDWPRQQLCLQLQVLSSVSALDYCSWADITAVGGEDGSVSLFRASTAQLLSNFLEPNAHKVVQMQFVARDIVTEANGVPRVHTRLFLALLHEKRAFSFMHGKKRRAFCDLSVLEIEPWSGAVWGQVFSHASLPGARAVLNSLLVQEGNGIYSYLTVEYPVAGATETDDKTVYLHELDPLTGIEHTGILTLDPGSAPVSPLSEAQSWVDSWPSVCQWELLGVGSRFVAVALSELIQDSVTNNLGRLSLVVFERSHKELWPQTLLYRLPEPDWFMYTSIVLGKRCWLDGFDGTNDNGLAFSACFQDFNTGLCAMQNWCWSEPT